ncbi:MAG: HAMP domain-containing histidine kinase [Sphingomonadaceae bacterium]|nr:HAMP domain-containing histidine kinase [Sphingomonadaceae bacterium]
MSAADHSDPGAHAREDSDESVIPPAHAIERGQVDGEGRLIEATARLAALNTGAGGTTGGPLAVPQLASLVRLARRLDHFVERPILAAEGENDVALWVRARPAAEGIELLVSGWHGAAPVEPQGDDGEREHDFLRAESDWSWESDTALRLTALSEPAMQLLRRESVSAPIGLPLARVFRLVENGDAEHPLLNALADQSRFDNQRVALRGSGARFRLAGLPLIDGAGHFAGFRGTGTALGEHGDADAPAQASAFARQLDRALRLPLDRIIAGAESIRAQADGAVTAEYVVYAADIASAGRHMLGLVDDLVDLEAIERPGFRPPAEPIDLADLARRAAGLLGVRAADKRIAVERPAPDLLLTASADFRRTLQILVNLIGNAIRFSPEESTVRIEALDLGDSVAVAVIDEGPGIARRDQERIFEKFERLGASVPGTGLGLYIARRLARAMDGDVLVESRRGKGARFTLRLPAGK